MSDFIGTALSERYQIISLLGEGGMGGVYKGRDLTLERDVALKIMHGRNLEMGDFAQRFLQEARAAARLSHPGIVQVFDFGNNNGLLYIVMEFILGENLDQMMRRLRRKAQWLALNEAVELVRQVALALDYVHRQGVVHRDIKPANIMIKAEVLSTLPYRPVITDLGLAKLAEGGMETQLGIALGTPAYMAPEQIRGEPLDARSDIYSLGILFYELAVGQLPFPIQTFTQITHAHIHEAPPPPQSLFPDLPDAVADILLKSLAKTPDDRYASGADLAQALQQLPTDLLVNVIPPVATSGVGSLLTQHHESLVAPLDLAPLLESSSSARHVPHILVQLPNQRQQAVAITTMRLTIGRQPDNTVILDDDKASRHHATIEFDGQVYWVTDLASTNGTFLGQERLTANTPTRWDPEISLHIGDHHLFLRNPYSQAIFKPAGLVGVAPASPLADPPAPPAQPLTVVLSQSEYSVVPGESVQIPVILHNQGEHMDQLHLSVAGIPREWVALPMPTASLSPGAQQLISLTISPPRTYSTTPARYPLQIQVNSQHLTITKLVTQCTLQVTAYTKFQSGLFQAEGANDQQLQVRLSNQGNTPQIFQLNWRSLERGIIFNPPEVMVQVPPGNLMAVTTTVRPQQRAVIGLRQRYTIQAQVVAGNGEVETHTTTYVNEPLLPIWLTGLLTVLLLLLVGSMSWYLHAASGIMGPLRQLPTPIPIQVGQATTALSVDSTPQGAEPIATVRIGNIGQPTSPTLPTTLPTIAPTSTATGAQPIRSRPATALLGPSTALPVTGTVTTTVQTIQAITTPVLVTQALTLPASLVLSPTPITAPTALALPTLDVPQDFVKQGYALTQAVNDGQNELLVWSQPRKQFNWQWVETLSEPELQAQRQAGSYIVHLTGYQGRWGIALASDTGYLDQAATTSTEFPQAFISTYTAQDFYITQLVYGNGQWAVVMTKGAGLKAQTWNIEAAFPATLIQSQQANGYAVTQLVYDGRFWVVVMSQGSTLANQEVITDQRFPEELLRQKQQAGAYITQLTYTDGLWIVIVSTGAPFTEQTWLKQP